MSLYPSLLSYHQNPSTNPQEFILYATRSCTNKACEHLYKCEDMYSFSFFFFFSDFLFNLFNSYVCMFCRYGVSVALFLPILWNSAPNQDIIGRKSAYKLQLKPSQHFVAWSLKSFYNTDWACKFRTMNPSFHSKPWVPRFGYDKGTGCLWL